MTPIILFLFLPLFSVMAMAGLLCSETKLEDLDRMGIEPHNLSQ